MLFFEKSQPAPECLKIEKVKKNGDYKCGDVLSRLKTDFKNKCYLCERKAPVTINVEHFKPHKNNADLKYDWNNLFWACGHCNNTKLGKYSNLLNSTDPMESIESKIHYEFKPFPKELAKITPVFEDAKTIESTQLLMDIFNGTTKLKLIESANIRSELLREIKNFQEILIEYFDDTIDTEQQNDAREQIRRSLHKASSFTSFKRWIIRDNETLFEEFEQFLSD